MDMFVLTADVDFLINTAIQNSLEEINKIMKGIDVYSPDFSKKIFTKDECVNESAARKKGFTAQQVADIICRDNPSLLERKEIQEMITYWNTDRKELKDYRRRERIVKKEPNKT
jgi:hypothetical protein